jgi:hypothetical protein
MHKQTTMATNGEVELQLRAFLVRLGFKPWSSGPL